MATAFRRTLGAEGPVNPEAYDLLVQELKKLQAEGDVPGKPMYTLDEQRDRVRQSNDALRLGIAGSMSPDEQIRAVNSRVFARTLADRDEKETDKGTFDPLTGETRVSPEYAQRRRDERRAKVTGELLRVDEQRARARERVDMQQERLDRQAERDEDNRMFRKTLAGTKAGADAEMTGLKKDLIRAQTDATRARADTVLDKREATADKAVNAAKSAVNKAGIIIKNIGSAEDRAGPFTTGIIGSVAGKVPGTTAYDLRRDVDTIKANIGFEELSAMRQASPTGGALGQVAVRELDYLQAVLGSLDPNQSQATLRRNLADIKKHYMNWEQVMMEHAAEAEARRGGGVDSPTIAPAQSSPGAAPTSPASRAGDTPPPGVDPKAWKYMTPQERALWR